MLRLRTFGGLSVERNGEQLSAAAASRRRIALLPLLAVAAEHGVSREKALAYLWPESDTERARNALAQTLHALRRELGEDDLFIVGRELRLNADVISSDVAEFEAAIRRSEHELAAELYAGPFLDGFYLREAPEFERWVETERARIEQQAKDSLRAAATKSAERGDDDRSVEYWRRLAALDPLSSQAAIGLMTALARGGDRAAALDHARIHEEVVRQELGAEPDPAVGALTKRLRDEVASGYAPLAETTSAQVTTAREETRPSSHIPPTRRRWRRPWIAAGAVGLAAVLGGAIVLSSYETRKRLDPNLVVVAPFDVLDPALQLWREGLVDVLSRNLDGAGPLRTVSPTVVIRRWTGRADPASAADLARKTGARLAIVGSLFAAGEDSVRLQALLLDAASQRKLAELELREVASRMDRLTDSLTVRLLRELSRTHPIGAAVLAAGARPSWLGARSLPVLKAFLQGEQFFRRSTWDSAIVYYERVVALDSGFAPAFWRLGWAGAWFYRDSDSLSLNYSLRAGALNRGLAPRESLLVASDSLEAAMIADFAPYVRRFAALREEAARRYPGDPETWYALGEARYHWSPDVDATAETTRQAFERSIALDSAFRPAYEHLIGIDLFLGDTVAARRHIAAYLAVDPASPGAEAYRLVRRVLDGEDTDYREIERLLKAVSLDVRKRAWHEGFARWADTAEIGIRAARLGVDGDSSRARVELALGLLYRGHFREAWRLGHIPTQREIAVLGLPTRDSAAALFGGWLRTGDVRRAVTSLRWWASQGDTASVGQVLWLCDSTLRSSADSVSRAWARYGLRILPAYLALARRDTTEALRRFQTSPQPIAPRAYVGEHFTKAALLTARATNREMLSLADPVTWSSAVSAYPTRILVLLGQARVAERIGDRERAIRSYRHVAEVWRHGDPELQPYVAEARAALKRLRR